MAYRSGFSYKDKNQERILAFDFSVDAFKDILAAAVVTRHSTDKAALAESDVVIQWDPERNVKLEKMDGGDIRSIQIGLRRDASDRFSNGEGVVQVTDVTDLFRQVHGLVEEGNLEDALALLPVETVFDVGDADIALRLGLN
ncbi:hypothetical protein HDU97_004141 [Phlyctochytrium planicorne]|nr:hypothetical protein HDU97_004141 [Phlyctochytrium planicorne]